MLGVPESDVEQLRAWSENLAAFVGSATDAPDKAGLAEASSVALTDILPVLSSRAVPIRRPRKT